MATQFVHTVSALLLACLPAVVSAQMPQSPNTTYGVDSFLLPPETTRPNGVSKWAEVAPLSSDPCADLPFLQRLEFHPRAEATQLLKFGDQGLGVTELEAKLAIEIRLRDDIAPIRIVPGAAWRWFEGPASPFPTIRPDLPPWTSDFYVEFSWRPRLAKWLFIDLKVTPGYYSDLDNLSSDGFRTRGHGLAIIALSEKFQLLAGVAYVNRYNYRVVPIGGFRWMPNEDIEIRLLVPAPRISYRIATRGETTYKLYLAGEYGGGIWAIRRQDGQNDSVDYSDYRLLAGLEAELPGDRRWYAEFGWAFKRRIDYDSGIPSTFRPNDTLLFRLGFTF